MDKLLSCPFCGGKAFEGYTKPSHIKVFYVGCMDCTMETFMCESTEEAIKAWNTRADNMIPISQAPEYCEVFGTIIDESEDSLGIITRDTEYKIVLKEEYRDGHTGNTKQH